MLDTHRLPRLRLCLNPGPVSLRGPSGSVSGSNSYILSTLLTHLSAADTRYVPTPPTIERQLPVLPQGSPGPFRPNSPCGFLSSPNPEPQPDISSWAKSERENCRFIQVLLPLLTFLQLMPKTYPLPCQWRPNCSIYLGEALDHLDPILLAVHERFGYLNCFA